MLKLLSEKFSQLGRPMPEINLRQCYRPEMPKSPITHTARTRTLVEKDNKILIVETENASIKLFRGFKKRGCFQNW